MISNACVMVRLVCRVVTLVGEEGKMLQELELCPAYPLSLCYIFESPAIWFIELFNDIFS